MIYKILFVKAIVILSVYFGIYTSPYIGDFGFILYYLYCILNTFVVSVLCFMMIFFNSVMIEALERRYKEVSYEWPWSFIIDCGVNIMILGIFYYNGFDFQQSIALIMLLFSGINLSINFYINRRLSTTP